MADCRNVRLPALFISFHRFFISLSIEGAVAQCFARMLISS
jgi:hypothetical protein